MRNLHLLHSLRMQNAKLAGTQVVCVDIDTKNVYCVTETGIYGLDPTTQQILHAVSLVDTGYLSTDGAVSVVGAEYLADQTSVCLTTSRGDLIIWNTVTSEVECVGSVDHGLTAMCWSTDQELLVLSTGQNTLIMMTREFDPISEMPMFSDQFGEAQFVNVGWGKKETQFHGTEGKNAATKKAEGTKPAFDWDDKKPRICWHGDGQFFVVSAVHPRTGSRQLCVWTREGVLHSTSEQVPGVEQALGWKSTGNLITTSQRKPNKHDIIFFEKNGLRHGEFTLPFGVNECKVQELTWNTESNILAVWVEDLPKGEEEMIPNSYIQLWTVSNYHWYLKQSLRFRADDASRVSALCWDQEQACQLHVTCHGGEYLQYTWGWSTDHSHGSDVTDLMNVAVIDGTRVLVTPFRQTVVPPPMAAYQLELSAAVNQVVFAPPTTPNDMMVIMDINRLARFSFEQGEKSPPAVCGGVKVGACGGNGFTVKCTTPCSWQEYSLEVAVDDQVYPCKYSHVMWTEQDVLLLCAGNSAGTLSQLHRAQIQHDNGTVRITSSQDLEGHLYNTAISIETGHVALQLTDGTVLQYDSESDTVLPWTTASGEELSYTAWKLCSQMDIATIGGEEVVIGLTDRYQLYVNNIEVATNCTSYAIHDEFLLLTTYAHTCRCICRKTNVKVLSTLADGKAHPFDESVRRVERGSRIVCVVPEDTKVVLQMPRGNLEVIHPRALVLSAVRRKLDRLQFRDAFTLMRKHRINMNLIYDHNPARFIDKIDQFIEQVSAPGLINQFLTDLQEEDVTKTMYTAAYSQESNNPESQTKVKVSKIDVICDHMRSALQRIDPDKFLLSILTAYVRKSAPELDTALKLIKELKGGGIAGGVSAEEALKYLLFLVDVNELYDIALGTYDFDLVLLVAEKSQKDPKEYIPFLNSLRKMEENYQHFTIDKYLKRYASALGHIVKCGDAYFTECLDLIKEQRLYREGLASYKLGSIHYKEIAVEYAKFLLEKKHPEEAGLILSKAEQWSAAVDAFERGLNWRLALCMAHRAGHQGHTMEELCKRLADNLKEQSRHAEAAMIHEQHLNDIEEAIVTLVEGSQWEEALRLMHKSNRTDFIETHFNAALLESQCNYVTLLEAIHEEFVRHSNRLTVVRAQKERARLEFLEGGELNTADADLFSDTSSATGESAISGRSASQMTADSQRSSIFSKKTGRSAKTRRKQERKKWSLKEGSTHEDVALIEALSKACKQVEEWKGDISSLLRMLMMFHHQKEAELLQDTFERLLTVVEKSVPEIWPDVEVDQGSDLPTLGPHSTANAIAQAVQQGKVPTSEIKIDPSLRVPPPLTKDNKWKLHSSDIHR